MKMRFFKLTLAALIVFTQVQVDIAQANVGKPWKSAVYHGLVMGKSTRADVLKALGKPKWVGHEQDTGTPIITYDVADPVPGVLTVYINKGILESLALEPKKALSRDDIVRLFGHGYIAVHYSADECLDEGGAAPVYQDPKGHSLYWEYRDRDLAAMFHYNDEDSVDAILFLHGPIGPAHSLCTKKGQK